jgi:hypothetical protein
MKSQNVKIHSQFLKRIIFTLCTLPLLCAWVDPVDLSVDQNGETDVQIGLDYVKSCKPAAAIGAEQCHRWNLVWEPVKDANELEEQINWDTNLLDNGSENEWRLPTIKELSKLINFGVKDTNTLIESAVIKDWFTGDQFWDDNSAGLIDESEIVWLISSSFRDIDGVGDNSDSGYAQVFAINILTGEIKTFEPGAKLSGFGKRLRLCEYLNIDGDCHYASEPPNNTIFALKVRTELVEDLINQ